MLIGYFTTHVSRETAIAVSIETDRMAPWLNWIEQVRPKDKVAGSTPAGVTTLRFGSLTAGGAKGVLFI